MKGERCIALLIFIVSAISASAGLSNVDGALQDKKNGRSFRQLSLVTRPFPTTGTTTVSIVCAKLVNVTGPCRRRRGFWMEEPVVISFNEETEKLTDILFTPVYSIEPTVAPTIDVSDEPSKSIGSVAVTNVEDGRLGTSIGESQDLNSSYALLPFPKLFELVKQLLSSILPAQPSARTAPSTFLPNIEPSVLIGPAASMLVSNIRPPNSNAPTGIRNTVTVTDTFFIQLCTPSPFPFAECLQSRNRALTQNLER